MRRYQPAQALADAVADGQVDVDEAPGLYRYEIHGLGDPLVGVVGLIAIADLLPHEGVRRKRQGRRRDLFEIRPILVIADGEVEVGAPGRSVLEIAGAETSHRILQVSPGDVSIPPPPYVIADGHHRTQVALRDGGVQTILAMVVGRGGRGLRAGSFHRRFRVMPPLPGDVGDDFVIDPAAAPVPVSGAITLVSADGSAVALRPRQEALRRLAGPVRGFGSAVAAALLYPHLGITEEDATYARTIEAAVGDLEPGSGALLLPPSTPAAVVAAARAGVELPPKATQFSPKPARGALMRLVD